MAFASFIPAVSCRSGLIEAIGLSMAARADWATSLIEAASAEMKAHGAPGEDGVLQNVLSRSIGPVLEWQAGAALERIRLQPGTQGTTTSEEEADK